jgi:hypothetical protein
LRTDEEDIAIGLDDSVYCTKDHEVVAYCSKEGADLDHKYVEGKLAYFGSLFEHCCGSFSECGEERYRVKIQIAPEIFQFVALHYWKQFPHLFHYVGPFSLMAKLQISSLSLLRIHDCTNNLGVTEEEEVVRCNDYSF